MAAPGGMTQMGLGILVNAQDMASGPLRMLGRNFNTLVDGVGRGAAVMTGAFALIAGGAAALTTGLETLRGAFRLAEYAGEFEQLMIGIQNVAGATSEELVQLREAAIQAGTSTQFSPQQAAEGLQALAQAGLNAQRSIAVLNPVLDLAAGSLGEIGVGEAASAVVGTMNAYSMSADQAASVTDRLLRATQQSNLATTDFEVGLSRAAASGAQYGTSLNDTLVLLGLMRNLNIEASVASTALREAERRVMTDEQALQELRRVGVRAYEEGTGAARSALPIMQDVARATRDMTDEERNAIVTRIFGARGILAFNSVANAQTEIMRNGERTTLRGAEAIAYMNDDLQNATGTAENFREAILGTFRGQMQLLSGAIATLGTVVGLTFGRIFRPMVLVVTRVIQNFIRVWQAIPEGAQTIIGAIVLLGAALLVFGGVIGIVVGTVVLLIMVLGEVLLVILAVAVAIVVAMLPVIAIMAGVAGLALLVYRAWEENLGGLRDWLEGWTNRVSLAWHALVALFSGGGLSGSLREEFNRAENAGVRDFVGQIFDFGYRVREFFNGFQQAFRSTWKSLGPLWAEFRVALQELFVQTGRLFGSGPGSIVTGVNSVDTNTVNGMGQSFGQQLAQGLRLAVQALTAFVQAATMVMRIVEALTPIFRVWWTTMVAIVSALRAIAGVAADVGRSLLAMWNTIPAPLRTLLLARVTGGASLAVEGLQTAARATGQAMAPGRAVAGQEAEALAAQARLARKREEGARTEAGTASPAAVQAREQEADFNRLVALLERREGGDRGGRQSIQQLTQSLNISGEKVSEIVTRIQERRGNLEGQVTSTAGGSATAPRR